MDSPSDIEALRAALAAERGRAAQIEAELALARAQLADDAATITRQNLEIAKLKRQIYGPRSERTVRLLDQMELVLEELEADATEDEIAAERPIIAYVDPASAGVCLALGQHGHRGVVTVQSVGSEDMALDTTKQRLQRRTSRADLIGERRQGERHALAGIALGLTVQRLVLTELLEQQHGHEVQAQPSRAA